MHPQQMFDPANAVRYHLGVALHRLIILTRNKFLVCAALLIIGGGCSTPPITRSAPVLEAPARRSFAASSTVTIPLPPMPRGMQARSMTVDVPAPSAGPGLSLYLGEGFVGIGVGPSDGAQVTLLRSTNLLEWATIFEGQGPVLWVEFEPLSACFYRLNY